ncbi:hypothetical protein [Heyndrickxia ginsengihumi]|uniref:hypothetical protein n=1 Tax=Heyndrickxia ginsengihumi TaxID=363870 RepID=UPI003D1AC117
MISKRNLIIFTSIYTLFIQLPALIEMVQSHKSIITVLLFFVACQVAVNILALSAMYLSIFVTNNIEKQLKKKYSLYEWLGNPTYPNNKIMEKIKGKKQINSYKFAENRELVKDIIKEELKSKSEMKSYLDYLKLQSESNRLSNLLTATQTILIAVITSSLITVLNFSEVKTQKVVFSYFFFILFVIALYTAIYTINNSQDRNKFLKELVEECVNEPN